MVRRFKIHRIQSKTALLTIVGLFGVIGVLTVALSSADTFSVNQEIESGVIAGCASSASELDSSGGEVVRLGDCQHQDSPGAVLPIQYDLATLTGTPRYVAPNGNDATGNGSVGTPFATLAKAISVVAPGDSVVLRGGTYRGQASIVVPANKVLKIIAYPGEIPVFNGARTVDTWTSEGNLRYVAYTPRPVTDGSGISFTTGQNLTGDGVGKYADQAWVGTSQLRQVSAKTAVVAGSFWVDQTNKRLYMSSADTAKGQAEITQGAVLLTVQSPSTSIEGIKVTRYSNTASDYGVIKFQGTADNSLMENVEITDSAFMAVFYDGSGNINSDAKMEHITIARSNWMGISATLTDDLTLDSVKLTDMNQFNEFTFSPQTGALKTSRTWHTKVLNSDVSNNNSHALWFDQSNYDVQVANNTLTDNKGSSVFFEISDNLLLINNYIRSTSGQPVKLAGSSGLKLVNNTIVGGPDAVGVYTDNRSKPGCANPSQPLCANSYGSDRDNVRTLPSTMDWMPRVDLMLNNIIAYPAANGFCGVRTALCATQTNGDATVTLQSIFHQADASRGIPQTRLDGNVYTNVAGIIFAYNTPQGRHSTTEALSGALATAPVNLAGQEARGLAGDSYVTADGTPTPVLAALHNQAADIPNDPAINAYLRAGTRHYGVTNR
jgi:hypothetical protein